MRHALLIAMALLAACESGQPVPTSADNAQLDDAANMLDRADENLANVDEKQLPPSDGDIPSQ